MATGITEPERSGWRDENISRRHRLWGVECQASDIDFLMCEYRSEYDDIRPVAIIEYKNERAAEKTLLAPQYVMLKKLGDSALLPVFVVRYKSDFSNFLVVPVNKYAASAIRERKQMQEKEYVNFLYNLRGYNGAPKNVLDNLGD